MRLTAILAIGVTITLGACDFQQVRLGSAPKPGVARLVYGLDASGGPLSVSMEYEVPEGGACAPMTKAANSEDATAVEYFSFDVIAGAYSVSRFHTSGELTRNEARTFLVPAGRQTYIGTFHRASGTPRQFDNRPLLVMTRDVDAARTALGDDGASLELAEPVRDRDFSTPLCSF